MVKAIKSVSSVTSMVGGGSAIGPYSAGKIITTANGTWGYSSGQIGKHPKTGLLVS